MKPLKSFFPLAVWIMRLAIVLFAITRYFDVMKTFHFASLLFYIGTLQILFSILLFIGGFFSRHTLTVVSALVVFIITVYHIIVVAGNGFGPDLAMLLLYCSTALYFVTRGNDR